MGARPQRHRRDRLVPNRAASPHGAIAAEPVGEEQCDETGSAKRAREFRPPSQW